MKQKIAAAIVLMALTGMVSAMTNIQANLINYGGQTKFAETAEIKGYDWSEGKIKTTGWIQECLNNDGTLTLQKQVYSPGQWELVEQKNVWGSGETLIEKGVRVWTEDQTLWENGDPNYRNPTGAAGEYAYPTRAWIDVIFATDYMTDIESVEFLQNIVQPNSNEGYAAYFGKTIHTNENFYFGEMVGIGMCNNCELPELPECVGPFCQPVA